jgi:phenylalanyl-tRNA synthetase beta chain
LHRAMTRALAMNGLVETLSYPFVGPGIHDDFGLPADDPRRNALRVVNPLSDTEPELRTSLLPGLLATVVRNVGRGNRDLAIFEAGLVFERSAALPQMPAPAVTARPTDAEVAALYAAVPAQPRRIAAAFTGDLERPGWWGKGRAATWADAVAAAQVVVRAARATLEVRPAQYAPWHPGRCAALLLEGVLIGYAGELHPRVVAALGLPARTCAMELDVDAFVPPGPAPAPHISTFPPVLLDVALVVDQGVASADVLAALRDGAGELLESARLFDVYADESRLGPGLKSLAFALRFRAPDRTLTVDEANEMRDAAIAQAAERTGARLRT